MRQIPDRDMEALRTAIMFDIDCAEQEDLRRLLWRARIEGAAVGVILSLFIWIFAWAVMTSIRGPLT